MAIMAPVLQQNPSDQSHGLTECWAFSMCVSTSLQVLVAGSRVYVVSVTFVALCKQFFIEMHVCFLLSGCMCIPRFSPVM